MEFFIYWQDSQGAFIRKEWVEKGSYEEAVASTGLRLYQSPRRCPPNARGFFIAQEDNLPVVPLDKRLQKLQLREISERIERQYGDPPPEMYEEVEKNA